MPDRPVPTGPAGAEPPGARPAARTVTVHLLRHGLVHNPGGILYGRLPGFHLSSVGAQMAQRVAGHLANADIGYLAASPLERAGETAAPLAAALDLDVVTDARLIEPTNVFEGTRFTVGDGLLRRPRNWAAVRDPLTPSWGEPYLAIARRMLGAIYTAVSALADPTRVGGASQAVLVSHQLPIWTVRRFLCGQHLWHNPAHRQCAVASLTSLTFVDGVLSGLRYSEPAADLLPTTGSGRGGA